MKTSVNTESIVNHIRENYGDDITTKEVELTAAHFDLSPQTIKMRITNYRSGRGTWSMNLDDVREDLEKLVTNYGDHVPQKDPKYVPFGNFTDVKKILRSGAFFPCFITGMSGNGKTVSVEQACAQLGRELIRVNITIETDEDDLIGGFRLDDPNDNTVTVWQDGPVIQALKRGAVLLLDEVDLASNKIMCLQSILEGKGIYIKKTGEFVPMTPGFNIVATANTKGQGCESGKFIGTNVLNEAFLERFALTFEQQYPTITVEQKILANVFVDDKKDYTDDMKDFAAKLCKWANKIRSANKRGFQDEVISTRRLVHIVNAYKVWGDRTKAVKMCLNRFDEETKTSFLDYYDKVDENVEIEVDE